ncbi:MAG: sulfatase-like hydrolase/transferase [Gammaproteobacteria bacterium]|nr:sulfatase-like hydrolase/transferase [Gammaproteobacteria bacterium]
MNKPNFVIICTDQQRSDSLGCYDNCFARTPNIDTIAMGGARLDRHSTPNQLCSPSRATLITGLYPRHHGLTVNGTGMALSENASTLPSALSENGYRTHGVGKQHLQPRNTPAEYNMLESHAFWSKPESRNWNGPYYGYQTIDLLLGISDTAHLSGHYANWLEDVAPGECQKLLPKFSREPIPDDYEDIWQSAMPVELHYNTWISDRAVSFLDSMAAGGDTSTSPFFMFVSYPDPHHPFDPPSDYAIRYDPQELPKPSVGKGERERIPPYCGDLYPWSGSFRESYRTANERLEAGKLLTTDRISENSLQKAIAHTYAMIEMIDDGVGRILGALSDKGFAENTVVVFTSDHGEYLGDHGILHKGPASYRQVTEVSMLMKGPGITPGIRVGALTGHMDIAPTILDLAGLQHAMPPGDGTSLLPLLQEKSTGLREFDFGEYHPRVRKDLYNQTIRTGKWRLTSYPQHPEWGELFDLDTDPGEHYNLFPSLGNSRLVQDLSEILKEQFPARP